MPKTSPSLGWKVRFWDAIDADGRSLRAISLEAGLGPNYLEQARRRNSTLSVDGLLAVLDVVGTASMLYVMTGIKMDAQVARFISASTSLDDPALVADAAAFFARLLVSRRKQELDPDHRD